MLAFFWENDTHDKIAGIHFTTSDELHTLGALYESMLCEMDDAAGDSCVFYTPRAVVRFMVTVADPRLGETVLDPANGTRGVLVEAHTHLAKQDHRGLTGPRVRICHAAVILVKAAGARQG